MHAFSIDKKMDYSAPIFFVPLGLPAIQPVQKAVTLTTQKVNQKASQPKRTSIAPIKPEIKKQEIKPITIETPKNAPQEKIEVTPTVKKPEDLPQAMPEKKKAESSAKQASPAAVPIQNAVKHEVKHNAQISNNYREVEALRRGAQLQKELVTQWHPPMGISPGCTCDISFFVNKQGTIENLKTIKSSGIIMFDISARQALFSMKMPQWTHGKPLTISFKQ